MSDKTRNSTYPPIDDYAFIADSNSSALISRQGSVDWCCIERLDAGSCFGRLLDWEKGGFCSIFPTNDGVTVSREYIEDTLVLQTTFKTEGGEARVFDCFTLPASKEQYPYRQFLRIVEGVRGSVELDLKVVPRFDYGEMEPWIRQQGVRLYSAIGGNDGLLIFCDAGLSQSGSHDLETTFTVHAGERVRLSILSVPPAQLDYERPEVSGPEEMDRRLEETIGWWRQWSSRADFEGSYKPGVLRSAITIKGLMNDLTGAVAAAATTSLPEVPGGEMNWDYRFSWIRDSFFSVRSLAEVGFADAADAFRRFVERSSAGNVRKLQIMYGLGGERRLTEQTVELEGYRNATPVRVGNAASGQLQLDMFGELLELSWRWHRRGNSPDDDYWRFLLELVDRAAELWKEPDHGIWEMRGEPRHFTFSKVMCWTALDRGLKLAEECMRKAPEHRWKQARDEVRETVEREGYDRERGIFTQTFGSKELDAALLLMPEVGFLDYRDERMIRTAKAISEQLSDEGLLKRFRSESGEGAFVACSFWLVECLAHQGQTQDAREIFDRTIATGNDLGLFSEEYDTGRGEMLGNFPQGLSHLSHISAAVALEKYAYIE